MAQLYTPFLSQAGAAIGQGLAARGQFQREEEKKRLIQSAYMGDPGAMAQLQAVDPQAASRIETEKRQRKQLELQTSRLEAQQKTDERGWYLKNKEVVDKLFADALKLDSAEEAQAYVEDVAQRNPELFEGIDLGTLTPERFDRLKKAKRPDTDKATERVKKIQGLVDRGIDRNLASDIVEGRVKVTSPDQFGNVYAVNITDSTKKLIVSGGQPVPSEDREPPSGDITPSDTKMMSLVEAAEKGTGPTSAMKSFVNNMVGPFVEGQPFPETTESKSVVKLFNQEAKTALVNNPKFPVAEQEIIKGMLPDVAKVFTDPDTEREKVIQLRNFLNSKKQQNNDAITRGNITEKRRGQLVDQNSSIDRVIGLMGKVLPTPQTQEEFDSLPSGTVYIDPDDGKRYRKP